MPVRNDIKIYFVGVKIHYILDAARANFTLKKKLAMLNVSNAPQKKR